MGWVVQSLGFDQERLGQPGFFLGWDRRMPRKAQVVFGRPTSANESFTARTWRNDVWAPAKLTWGLVRLVFFFFLLSRRHFYYWSLRGVVKYAHYLSPEAALTLTSVKLPGSLPLSTAPPLSPLHPLPSLS